MAKRSSIARNQKRIRMSIQYLKQRQELKKLIQSGSTNLEAKYSAIHKLRKLPRNSAPSRVYRRCIVTGRPRAVYRDFGLSRHVLREMAHECLLPGITKASW